MSDQTPWPNPSDQPYQPAPQPYDPYGGELLAPPEPPRRRRGVLIGAGSAFVVLVAGAGVYVTAKLAGGGLQPEALAPRSTFAFVRVDRDPAAGQKIAIKQFADHFPSAPKSEAEDLFGEFVTEALQAQEEKLDYEADVKPWLGKRVGIAGFTMDREPKAIGIIQTDDESKARVSLDKIAGQMGGDFAYRLTKGYAVIGENQAVVDYAVAEAEKSALADYEQFDADVDRLTGDQVVVAWADLKGVMEAAGSAAAAAGAGLPGLLTSQVAGRAVLGAHAASDYVEIEGLVLDLPAAQKTTNAKPVLLENLPKDTRFALSVNNLGATIDDTLAGLGPLGVESYLAELERETGISVKEDLIPLLGSQTVLAWESLPFFSEIQDMQVGLISKVADAARADATGQKVEAVLRQAGVPADTAVKDGVFYFGLGQGYLAKLQKPGDLGEQETFRKAMGDLGDEVSAALYVDIAGMVDSIGPGFMEDDGDLKALRAFGAWSGNQGDTSYFRARLAVR